VRFWAAIASVNHMQDICTLSAGTTTATFSLPQATQLDRGMLLMAIDPAAGASRVAKRGIVATRFHTQGIPVANASVDWAKLAAARFNVLIEGPRLAIESAVGLLERDLTGIVVRRRAEEPLDFTRCQVSQGSHCTLILEDVIGLNRDEQTRLKRSIDDAASIRIISTASSPVFLVVERGLFDATLYYRLNVMLIRVGTMEQPMARDGEATHPLAATRRSDDGR